MTLLLLAGTSEAREIAHGLADRNVPTLASIAGATRQPKPLPVPTRIGGFGGADGFRAYIVDKSVTAVLDATHPFAHRISLRTAQICNEMNVQYAQVLRPPWVPEDGDRWHMLDREEAVADLVPRDAVVFLATGRQTLERFSGLAGRRVYCRQIDPPDRPFPFSGGEYLVGRPPFLVADEVDLFSSLGVTWLVVKNAGGDASRTKLTAARDLGIDVAMISRPPQPICLHLDNVEAALDWVTALR